MLFSRPSSAADVASGNIAGSMRAITIEQAGPEGYLKLTELPLPSPKPHEVLIRVACAGVNRADMLQCKGLYTAPEGDSPLPGLEVSGTIIAVGSAVIGWSIDESVIALTNGGGYAEYVAVPAAQLLPLPRRLSLKQGASLPEGLATAAMALIHEAGLKAGERVLIHGGASGIGCLLVQVARALGATVFATASSLEKHDVIRRMGATPLFYDAEQFAESARAAIAGSVGGTGIDVVIDTLGGAYVSQHAKLLNPGGRSVSIAVLEGSKASLSMASVLMKHLRFSGATLRNRTAAEKAELMETVRKTLLPLVAAGMVEPVLDSSFALSEAEKAHERMENRLNSGKIVLEVQQETNT